MLEEDGLRPRRVSNYVFNDLFDIIVDMVVILPVIFLISLDGQRLFTKIGRQGIRYS